MTFGLSTMRNGNSGLLSRLTVCALDALFPAYCLCCDGEGQWACARCRAHLKRASMTGCSFCGKPIGNGYTCVSCCQTAGICQIVSVFHFKQRGIQELVHALKYDNIRGVAPWMGRCMAAAWQLHGGEAPEILIPIPLHRSRLREREYNQAFLLAHHAGREIGIAVDENLLIRSRKTASQTGLTASEREANVRGCFSLAQAVLPYKHIVLVDDVFTTGATLREAAVVLKNAGAQSVSALAFAHD